MQTRWTRVIAGGLAAGVVIDALEFALSGVLLVEEWSRALRALNRPGELPATAAMLFGVWGLIAGVAIVWLYSALRPTMGTGPRAALKSGMFVWLCAWALANYGFAFLGLFEPAFITKVTLFGILECALGALAGSWVHDR